MSPRTHRHLVLATLLASAVPAQAGGGAYDSMVEGLNGSVISDPLLTIGETLSGTTGALNASTTGDYTPVGVLDGMGAYALDESTVRVFATHELLHFRGSSYQILDGHGGAFSLTGARISYFDLDRDTRSIVDSGLAYERVYDANGSLASDKSFLANDLDGFSRFCSAQLIEAGEYGLVDTIFFAGEEDGGNFNTVGGAEWALDVANGDLWQLPALGRGAWENVTAVRTGNSRTVAFVLADDSSPFDVDGDGEAEAAPLFLYLGIKKMRGNFVERNGLARGFLYAWRANSGERTPLDFRGSGSLRGRWIRLDNRPRPGLASEDGSTGYDEYGYPTQRNLWSQAEAVGAFGFSRPEDVSTNPSNPDQVVLASTGVDTYAVDPATGDGADTFGTVYVLENRFRPLLRGFFKVPRAEISILYDGDADPTRALRSPDNLDWADDGYVYVQEDKAEDDTLSGEPLFGPGAANPNEAGIVRLDPQTGAITRVANMDRSVVLDPSIAVPTDAIDVDAGTVGEWESSGIVDVSLLFGQPAGSLLLFNVQAHGIADQESFNPTSRINDGDLVEGGQLLFLER